MIATVECSLGSAWDRTRLPYIGVGVLSQVPVLLDILPGLKAGDSYGAQARHEPPLSRVGGFLGRDDCMWINPCIAKLHS